ncbi:tyrosine-type recombinase/integrase [Clostridium tetani]|uniref:tyrosine-type recombinase/integrase n=1 Tax=Clostridium tetani TaxID=1513 RepID=UPI0003C0D9BA|nr:site-specific integrase [Clostridium tetani]CDI50609.1 phage integrase [Clostridium tetani 12124569]
MGAYRDESGNGTWFAKFTYTNWRGEKINKKKRGFKTKKAALKWEVDFLREQSGNLDMSFKDFFKIYEKDMKPRLRENTWKTKEQIIVTKVIPYIGDLPVNEISKMTIVKWQNQLMKDKNSKGEKYSQTYLRTIHAQLSSILNHACKYYNLRSNVARQVGSIGKKEASEMKFWTESEYNKFIEEVKDKPLSFYAFEILYWCGLRTGELLALTKEKFDFTNNTIRVNQSLQRISGRNIITEPKTQKSIRTVVMPAFLAEEMKKYMAGIYKLKDNQLLFPITKSYLHHEMTRGSTKAGVKRIRVHDLRHSHVSLLIELGYSAIAIADRLGHESIDITYRYAHLFPSKQNDMAVSLSNIRKENVDDQWEKLLEDEDDLQNKEII